MKKIYKIILGVVVLVVLGAAGIWFMTRSMEVDVLEAAAGPFSESFTEEGTVVSSQTRDVFSLHTATVSELLVTEGSRVAAGDVIVRLEDQEYQYSLQEMQAQLRVLDAQLRQLQQSPGSAEVEIYRLRIEEALEGERLAQEHYDRMEQLYGEDVIPKVELDGAQARLDSARFVRQQQEKALTALREGYRPSPGSREAIAAQKEALQAHMELLRFQQGRFELAAPIDGVVANLQIEEGSIAGPQTPLLTLYGVEEIRIEVLVLTEDVFDLTLGMPVEIVVSMRAEDRTFPAQVMEIAPVALQSQSALGLAEERVKVTLQTEVPDDLPLGPGYRVDARFIRAQLPQVITVPQTALFRDDGQDAVLVVDDGDRIRIVHVRKGLENRFEVVIEEGLSEGDWVVANPSAFALTEGDRVRPRSTT